MNKLRSPVQILLTLVIGLFLPFCFYAFCDAAFNIDVSPFCYIATVLMLCATSCILWVECFFATFLRMDPPDEPGSPYPPASAIIAAYLPNEADTILETIEAFLNIEYPAPLQVRLMKIVVVPLSH